MFISTSYELFNLLIPHCRLIYRQWGTVLFDGSTTEKSVSLPLKINDVFALTTFAYGSGVHSVFGGWHETDKLHLYRHSFFSENVNCVWFGIFH